MGQAPLIGQQQQALGILIQPAHRINPFRISDIVDDIVLFPFLRALSFLVIDALAISSPCTHRHRMPLFLALMHQTHMRALIFSRAPLVKGSLPIGFLPIFFRFLLLKA